MKKIKSGSKGRILPFEMEDKKTFFSKKIEGRYYFLTYDIGNGPGVDIRRRRRIEYLEKQ